MIGEPDAGKPHVRFDEGVQETCDIATRLRPTLPKPPTPHPLQTRNSRNYAKEGFDDPSGDCAAHVEVMLPARQQPGSGRQKELHDILKPAVSPRIPRISRLMALAIKFQGLVDRGEVRDYADLARLGYVTRARITQIMNLLNLAPDIQHSLLDTPTTSQAPHERHIRRVAALVILANQRRAWRELTATFPRSEGTPSKRGEGPSGAEGSRP